MVDFKDRIKIPFLYKGCPPKKGDYCYTVHYAGSEYKNQGQRNEIFRNLKNIDIQIFKNLISLILTFYYDPA